MLTLGPGHVIATQPATQTANPGGHVPNTPDANTNLMAPSNRRTGTVLTTQQAEEIRAGARHLGRAASKPAADGPVTPQPSGGASKQDDRGDSISPTPHSDISGVHAFHRLGETLTDLLLTTAGLIDPFMPSQLIYYWLFNADDDPTTGFNFFGLPGIDTGVEVMVYSDGMGNVMSHAMQHDYVFNLTLPLSTPEIMPVMQLDTVVAPRPFEDSVQVAAEYPMLRFTAASVPMAVVAQDLMSGLPPDFAETTFVTDYDATQPQLHIAPTLAAAGDFVTVQGHGFAPPGPARLYLDDALIDAYVPVYPDGSVLWAFPVPTTPPVGGVFDFVTLVDTDSRSGFSVLHLWHDCNTNGTLDSTEPGYVDCNNNHVLDACELLGNDCNTNGVPDACDPDANHNGTPDACESAICPTCRGDINVDGRIDAADIGGWVRCQLGQPLPTDDCDCKTGMTRSQFIAKLLTDPNTPCP